MSSELKRKSSHSLVEKFTSKKKPITEKVVMRMLQQDPLNLDFTEKRMGDKGLEVLVDTLLSKKVELYRLELMGNELTDSSAGELVKLLKAGKVKELNLEFNMLTNIGAKILATHLLSDKKLLKISLYQNKLTDIGGKYFAQVIGRNTTLKTLILFGNKLTDDSGLEFVSNLKTKTSLTVLDLRNTSISDEILETIHSCMKRNRGDIKDFDVSSLTKWQDSTTPPDVHSSDHTDVDEESDRSENTKSVSSMSQDELLRTVKKMQQKIRELEKRNYELESFVLLVNKGLRDVTKK
eukprot:gene11683-4918_t